MTLIAEDGTGIAGAESYATIAQIDAYWAARTNNSNSAVWSSAVTAKKEGAAREASSYLDSIYGTSYRGTRSGYVQGLEWPRTGALDDAGTALPALPTQLIQACCELAVRALSAPLAEDQSVDGMVKRKKESVGPISEETEYESGSGRFARYGAVDKLLSPILNGSQQFATGQSWLWY